MKVFNLPTSEEALALDINMSTLMRLRKGTRSSFTNDETKLGFRQASFHDFDPDSFLAAMVEILDTPHNPYASFDLAQIKNFGPYLRDDFSVWQKDCEAYFAPIDYRASHTLVSLAAKKISQEILEASGGVRLPLADFDESVESLQWEKKNTGFPYLRKDKDLSLKPYYVSRARAILSGEDVSIHPFVLSHRSSPRGFSDGHWVVKNRPVMMSEKTESILGAMIGKPALAMMRKLERFSGFDGTSTDFKINEIFRNSVGVVSSDFSKFDVSMRGRLLGHVFDILNEIIEDSPHKTIILNKLIENYEFGELWTPNGVLTGAHGLPSGVRLTSIIGSLANAIDTEYLKLCGVPIVGSQEFGDDKVIGLSCPVTPSLLKNIEYISAKLGLNVSAEKQEWSNNDSEQYYCSFLGKIHRAGFDGVVPLGRVASSLFWKKRFISDDEMNDIRNETGMNLLEYEAVKRFGALSVCWNHPMIEEVLKFVRNNCPTGLDVSLTGVSAATLRKYEDASITLSGFSFISVLLSHMPEADPTRIARLRSEYDKKVELEKKKSDEKREMHRSKTRDIAITALVTKISNQKKNADVRLSQLLNAIYKADNQLKNLNKRDSQSALMLQRKISDATNEVEKLTRISIWCGELKKYAHSGSNSENYEEIMASVKQSLREIQAEITGKH